jgi:hypothetical protein
MRRLPEGIPELAQSNNAIPAVVKPTAGQLRDRVELHECKLALTMNRCRGWCVRSECAIFQEARVRWFVLMQLMCIDSAYVGILSRVKIQYATANILSRYPLDVVKTRV